MASRVGWAPTPKAGRCCSHCGAGLASPVPGKATPARPLLLGGSLWPDLKRGDRCTHLRGVLKGKQRGHSIVLQVLAVPEGAEALGPEVLGADDRVLLGLEVGPAHVQHPLLQQLRPAEREPAGAGRGGAKQEASDAELSTSECPGTSRHPTPHPPRSWTAWDIRQPRSARPHPVSGGFCRGCSRHP